jgi:superfamily II DNA or RNA helicase
MVQYSMIQIRIGILHEKIGFNVDIEINNSEIIIKNYTSDFSKKLNEMLSYTDKSKQYQIRKMSRNVFSRNSDHYKKLVASQEGTLVDERSGVITVPSGFAYLFKNNQIIDNRKDTGKQVAFPWKTKPHDPRDYQHDGITQMCNNYRGLINFATGLGKTLTAVYAIRAIGRRALILCPSKAIADNFYQELCSAFGDSTVGYFGGGKKQIRDITVGIVQSVNNSIDQFAKHELGLVIFDEVHHLAADTFFSIAAGLSSVGRMFGLTATDFRSDGKDVMIQAGVGEVLIKRDIIWGIENKWLAYPSIIMREVETTGREYSDDKLKNYKAHVLNSPEMNERIIQDIKKCLEAKKSVLCLVDEKEHGRLLSEALGLPLATGDDKNSKMYVQQLNDGSIPGLIGTDSLIGEGCDTKNVDVLVLANFVASKGPLWQNLGRGLRRQGAKRTVLVLDYKPTGSKMLSRHADQRLKLYKAITSSVREV